MLYIVNKLTTLWCALKRYFKNIGSGLTALWRVLKPYLKNIGIAIDQLVNTVFAGYPDETISSRCWRENRTYAVWVIDRIFWWDRDENGNLNHCKSSYEHEMKRMDLPEEYREGMKHCDCKCEKKGE